MKKLGTVLILCACTLPISGCAIGPCYGVGCPAFESSKSAPPAPATATASTDPAPAQKKHHKFSLRHPF